MCLVGLNIYQQESDLFNRLCFPSPKCRVASFVLGRPWFSLEEAGRLAGEAGQAGEWEVREDEG